MRVALFTHQWPELRLGGIGTCVRQAAAALAAAGHEAHVFTLSLDSESQRNFPPGVIVHEVPTLAERVQSGQLAAPLAAAINAGGEGTYRLATGWLLTAAFRAVHLEQPFDVVEAPDVDALALPLLLDSARDCPVITHLHCCTAIAHEVNGTTIRATEKLIQSLEFSAIHLSDGLCAPTRAVVEATRAFMPIDRHPTIIPYPFHAAEQPFTPPRIDGPILFQGRLERLKGCAIIAEALNIFLPRNPTARFHFVGPDTSSAPGGGSMRRYILDTVSETVADRIAVLGELSRDQVNAEIGDCSFFVQPSLRENFSLVLCEAMAAGRTVIVGAGTGSVELMSDAGVVVASGSAADLARGMEELFRDKVRLAELSKRSYSRVRDLCDPETVTGRRIAFYRQAIEHFKQAEDKLARTATLPPGIAAALLPALSNITAALSGVASAFKQSPGSRLAEICGKIEIGDGGTEVLLYGAGKHTTRLMAERETWERRGHRVVGIIDDHTRFISEPRFLNLPVQSLAASESAARAGQKLPAVILSTDTYEDQFWENTAGLRKLGISVFRLYGHRQSA